MVVTCLSRLCQNPAAELAILTCESKMASLPVLQVRHPLAKSQDGTCNLLDSCYEQLQPGKLRKMLQREGLRLS